MAPNKCFQYLREIGFTTEPACMPLPAQLRGAVRLDALRVCGPPHRLTFELEQVQRQLEACETDLAPGHRPPNEVAEGELLGAALTRCTRMWCERFCKNIIIMIGCLL